MPLKIFVFRADRRREGCAFVMGVNEMIRVYGETVRSFESKEHLPKSVCYISFHGTSKTTGECGIFQIQCVPLATEPGISLIILTPMKILQRNLNRSTFVVSEMKRNVSVVCVCISLQYPH